MEKVSQFEVVFETSGGSISKDNPIRTTVVYVFSDEIPRDVAEWACSNRVIASQRVIRSLGLEQAKMLHGKKFTVAAKDAGTKAAFESEEMKKQKLVAGVKAMSAAEKLAILEQLKAELEATEE